MEKFPAIGNFSGNVFFAVICILIILKERRVVARVAAVIKVRGNMFRAFKNLNNETGMVLLMVLMTSIIIMIVSASILSQSMNEMNFAQQQIDEIASTEMAQGIFWNSYSSLAGVQQAVYASGNAIGPTIMQGRNYQMSATQNGTVTTSNTFGNSYILNVSYDSFQ